ncbi:MAG: Hpt domain-containing protein [Pseudomonas sp.]
MSALADAMNHAALGWVKPELDETLRQARAEIEAFAEAPADSDRMRACAGYLHQVQGTLRMLELYAPAMVAEELERLANAVQAGQVGDRDEACAMLMRGAVLLPDYLERLQNGHRDIPIVLLPLLNEIRAARGEPGLSESVLLALDPAAGHATPAELEHARGSLSGRNRELLDTVGNAVKEELLRVKDALDLHLRTGGEASELQAQVGALGAVADTLGMMGLGVARNVVVQQRDALRRIVEGEQAVDEGLLLDIAGALLYVDASLDDQVASLGAEAAGDVDAGANVAEVRRTVEVLAHEAIANFAAAREHFVAFIETHWDHARLAEVPQLLDEVGGAMRILDLPQPAGYLDGVRGYVQHELIERQRIPSGGQLDALADAMASLEYYLEALRERRPGREEILDITRGSLEMLRYWPLPAIADAHADARAWMPAPVEQQQVPPDAATGSATTLDEATGTGFFFDPVAAEEARHGIGTGTPLPVTLLDLPGDAGQAPDNGSVGSVVPDRAAAFDPVLAEQAADPPAEAGDGGVQLPGGGEHSPFVGSGAIAEALPIEQGQAHPRGHEVAVGAIELDEASRVLLAELDAAATGFALDPLAEDVSEVFAWPVAEVAIQGGFEDDGHEIDNDIRAVFLEEFDEELANLSRLLPVWRAAPGNLENLRPIRRVFHTLKGSGRLVGARALGEFSWKIEGMLNRVLDGSRGASPAVLAMVGQAHEVLPQLNAALRQGTPIHADLPAMQALADRIGAGEDAFYLPAQPQAVPALREDAAGEGTPASVDRVLREILEAEVAVHLETVHAWLLASQAEPQPATEPLLRAVHTMSGAFAMTDVPEITAVTLPAESYVKRALAAGVTPSQEGVDCIAATAAAISATIAGLQAESPRVPSFAALAARLGGLVDSLPEAQWPLPHFDDLDDLDATPATLAEPGRELSGVEDLSAYLDLEAPPSGAVAATPAPAEVSEAAQVPAGPEVFDVAEPIGATSFGSTSEQSAWSEPAVAALISEVAVFDADVAAASGLAAPADPGAIIEPAAAPATDELSADAEGQAGSGREAETVEILKSAVSDVAQVAEAGPREDHGPLDFQELDSELVDIFVEEGKDLLDHCDGLLVSLRETPEEHELLIGLQRDLHTLKGGARMAGINAIGDLGHGIESLLEAVAARRSELTRDDIDLLERGFDRLHRLLVLTGRHRAVAMPADLIEAFEARTHGRDGAKVGVPVALAGTRAQGVVPAPLSAPVSIEPQTDEEPLPRVQREQVRVRADLLDRLVNHAGEVAIYRSRLEQQLGAFRGAMGELERTNIRLRDQLRRLDLETEAQIVARYQREQAHADRDFDPLELDRFSTLQQLSRALNESAADLAGLQGVLDDLARQYDGLLQQQSRVSSELQDGLMRARMVPFDGLVPRLRRVVRQAAAETGKQVQLVLEGTHGELDRNVLDRMTAPLEHMLRNSVAHGLEAPPARRAAGKPEQGTITLRLRREGSEIVLEVADDGTGLDREAIRRRAEQNGLIAPGEPLAEVELDNLIFASGFSTSEQVSQLSGRGVGMDVVRNEVRQLGGSVDIHSVDGQGVSFTLRLPQTLAVTQAVFVRIGEATFAVPVASVSGIGRIARARYAAGEGGYHYAGEEYTLYDLGSLVGQATATADGAAQVPLLLVRTSDLRAAVAVDQVLGNHEIVVKPVGLQIASVPGIHGATITGDGRVVVILDVAPLVRRHLTQPARPVAEATAESQRIAPLVMVVDDSLTMRKVTGRVLERHNLEVVVARDGVEALEKLAERVPDLMLLDIEMPRMDGYELATAMRADERFKAVPIMMITSRSGEKHRQRAFEIGVRRYLGKPYQELDLMRNVYDLLGIARVRE